MEIDTDEELLAFADDTQQCVIPKYQVVQDLLQACYLNDVVSVSSIDLFLPIQNLDMNNCVFIALVSLGFELVAHPIYMYVRSTDTYKFICRTPRTKQPGLQANFFGLTSRLVDS